MSDVDDLDGFMESAADGPWWPEPEYGEDGLRRQHDTVWLTNKAGDALQVDEDTVAMIVNALRTIWTERGGLAPDPTDAIDAWRRSRQ